MRHYEVVYLVHPNELEHLKGLIEKHQALIAEGSGHIHRLEEWGRRQLAYPISNLNKAFYVLMNIECDAATLNNIEATFKFNDNILRTLVIRRHQAITEKSPIVRQQELAAEKEAQSNPA